MEDNPTTAEQQFELGKKYILGGDFNGHYVIPDENKAEYWLTKAAEQGHFDACCSLRSFYLKKNPAKAEYWHERSIQVYTKKYVEEKTFSSGGYDGDGCSSGCSTGSIIGIILGIIMFIICLVDGNGGNGIVAIIFLTIFGAVGGSVIGAIIGFFRKLSGR
ncbi:MAG: hypothetical protein LBC75_11480 [Fibromonadaceae bacterium]|jgi:TPR repeat protein|nr:hypothetical protein [Fibromonadaceae bacterium]